MFDQKSTGVKPNMELTAPATANPGFEFSNNDESDCYYLMFIQNKEELNLKMSNENNNLKDALKYLKKELLEIVCLMNDVSVR